MRRSGWRVTLVAALALAALRAPASAGERDPAEGKWLGIAGSDSNTARLGLDLHRSAAGSLTGSFYLDLLNLYGSALPSLVVTADGHYQVPEFGLDLALENGVLRGTLGGKARVELRRAATLPSDPPVPTRVPRGRGPRWTAQLGAPIWATATVRDHIAYVGTAGGVVNAVDVRDGHLVWTFAAGRPVFGEALATDDALFVGCDNGFLFKLERATGKELWRYDLGDARVSRVLPHTAVFDYDHEAPQPVLDGGVLYLGAGDGGFHAVNAASGEQVWRFDAPGKIRATAALGAERVFLGTLDGFVIALDRTSGGEVWRHDVKGAVTSGLTFLGDALIVGTRGSLLAALDPATGETRWSQSFWGSWVESTAARPDGDLAYIGSSDLRRVTAFDPADGRLAWRTDVYGWSWGAPVVTASAVYVATAGIEPYEIRHVAAFTALDRASGKIRWRWPVPRPPGLLVWGFAAGAARDGETLVVGGLDGTLYGFPAE